MSSTRSNHNPSTKIPEIMPPPTGVKLRDSCHLCATSKVKCSKDKPVCARCAERGTTCQYLVTQRTGRKARRPSSHEDHHLLKNQNQSTGIATPPSFPFLPTSSYPSSPSDPMSGSSRSSSWDIPSHDFGASNLDGLLPSLSPCPILSLSDSEVTQLQDMIVDSNAPHQPTITTSSSSSSSNIGLQDATTQFSCSVPSSEASATSSLLDSNSSSCLNLGLDSSHMLFNPPTTDVDDTGCLGTALGLMNQLSCENDLHQSSPFSHDSGSSYDPSCTRHSQRLDQVITDNKNAIHTIGCLLQTEDIKDGYCLVIISLVVSKILSRYAAAAQGGGENMRKDEDMTMFGGGLASARSSFRPDDLDPQTVQRVLAELYQVQDLVDKFSARLQASVAKSNAALTWSPFSSTMLNQLDVELRKRLSNLSLELIDGLRQYWG